MSEISTRVCQPGTSPHIRTTNEGGESLESIGCELFHKEKASVSPRGG